MTGHAEHEAAPAAVRAPAAAVAPAGPVADTAPGRLLALQQAAGNRAVARMVRTLAREPTRVSKFVKEETDHSLMGDYYKEGQAEAEVKLRHGERVAAIIGAATDKELTARRR